MILEGEVRWEGEIDSGVMVRKPELQLQIGVSRSLKRDMTCSFYVGNYPEEAQAKRAAVSKKAASPARKKAAAMPAARKAPARASKPAARRARAS